MKIMMFNGIFLFLLIMWTSAETEPETERTEGHQVYANESLVDTQARKRACENLGGKCVKKRKDCPSSQPLETEPGRPFCSRNHRCCYPGPSCSLAWDHEEHRPLIMIRETKTIVPPVDKDISDDPSRIPVGHKLVFACPGEGNEFNHAEGIHSKLHGECVAEDRFKVCVNNNPVYLDLSELSCSKKLFPSFIKQDNGTSDDNSCDELGGELYKQGYTYGDYHEFKDLDIDVCFRENNVNKTTLCTTSNLNGNETDYTKTADLTRRDTRMPCGGSADRDCPGLWSFKQKHVFGGLQDPGLFDPKAALTFTIRARKPRNGWPAKDYSVHPPINLVFNTVFQGREISFSRVFGECKTNRVRTYVCAAIIPGWFDNAVCVTSPQGLWCVGVFKRDDGHFLRLESCQQAQ